MSKDFLFFYAVIAIANFVLHLIHTRVYKESRRKFRKNWASFTIGFGTGIAFVHLPKWIYGLSHDFTALWATIFICGTGIIMLFVNRKLKTEE